MSQSTETAIIAVPAAIGPVRAGLNAATWCLVTRHRIRTCQVPRNRG